MTQTEFQEIIKIHIVGRVNIKDIAEAYRVTKKSLQAKFQRAGIRSNARCLVPGVRYKKCSDCKMILKKSEFYTKQTRCKACSMLKSRDFRKKNPGYDKRSTTDRKVRQLLKSDLKRTYGITPEDRADLMDKQKGCCSICGESLILPDKPTKTTLHVDHCHSTGKIRGLLCSKCNIGLGQFEDSPEILSKAIRYINDSRVNKEI